MSKNVIYLIREFHFCETEIGVRDLIGLHKRENMSNSLALRFLDYLDNHKPEQIVEDVIYEYFKKEFQQLPSVINELSKTGQLKISQIGDKLAYGVVSSIEMERNKGLNPEHKMLLQHIEEAGDLGIWTRDLKQNTKLSQVGDF